MPHELVPEDFRKHRMDNKTIYSKTGKGVLEIKNKAGKLPKDLVKVLTLIDGKSSVSDLMSKSKLSDPDMNKALADLNTAQMNAATHEDAADSSAAAAEGLDEEIAKAQAALADLGYE